MKRFILFFLLMAAWQVSFPQKVYFIYLQSEQEQPFFVKMNDKVLSSTASGYLIIPKLYDSSYSFNIGFVENKWPEQKFSVGINAKDHGYLLKNFGDKGWGLFDLQNLSVQMAIPPETKTSTVIKSEKKEVSEFTEILSKAADDSTLKEKQVLVKEEKKPDTIVQNIVKREENKPEEKPVTKTEESKVENKEQLATKKDETNPTSEQNYKRSIVTRKAESSTTAGVGLIFIDDYQNGSKDTIRILIPNPKPLNNIAKQGLKEEKKNLDIIPDSSKKENLQELKKDEKPIVNQTNKNNCLHIAVENDFLALRKNMAAKTDDDEMVAEAKKYFKTKCFTTSQIKNLSVLFLNDEGKYKFFDAAYGHTSDIENFNLLQMELKDEYYINRFKAMIRN